MSTAAILPELTLQTNVFGSTYYPIAETELVYHPGVIPPLAASISQIQLRDERKLGETELSYFLPSRESGVNDMYLYLGFNAPPYLIEHRRFLLVWTIMRVRHPLLGSKVKMDSYEDISFTYDVPRSPDEALALAEASLEFREQSKDELIDSYLNGPRTLSNQRLSHLIISTPSVWSHSGADQNVDFMICATHFLGDGMALHQFAHDFFTLFGGTLDKTGLERVLAQEWQTRCATETALGLPSSIEDRLPLEAGGNFKRLASRVDYDLTQQKLVGGHSFPRRSGKPRRTIVPTISLEPETTKIILKRCKANGVSISAALFAICNIAWARTHPEGRELPIMMYSALNMRPKLLAEKRLADSYWFLAIGYFNVVLPAFFPRATDRDSAAAVKRVFWHRARTAKVQSARAATSPMCITRARLMTLERGARARVWAKEDDDVAAGIPRASAINTATVPTTVRYRSKAPSTALLGLSLLGNLDGIYKHATFPAVRMHTLTTGSRQRAGGMLLFGYTFVNRLWISFGYDEAGFEESVVKMFWQNVLVAVDEFLVESSCGGPLL